MDTATPTPDPQETASAPSGAESAPVPETSTTNPPFNFTDFYTLSSQKAVEAAALQSLASALTLTLHNAVAEQQHGQILRMALTTAAASAILNGRMTEAQQVLDLAKTTLVAPDMSGIMDQIRSYLETIKEQLNNVRGTPSDTASAATSPV